jgi:hypothetical protein
MLIDTSDIDGSLTKVLEVMARKRTRKKRDRARKRTQKEKIGFAGALSSCKG